MTGQGYHRPPGAALVKPLKIAVAGVGSFTQRVLIPGLVACPDADVVAVFGPTADKTAKIAADHGIAASFSDYERMLDEADHNHDG